MSEQAIVTIQDHPRVVWAVLHQRNLDETVTEPMQQAVNAAAAAKPQLPVILDLAEVEYVPSMALGALVSLMRGLRQTGHRFILVGIHPMVRTTLAVTRLDKLFEIHPNFDEALKHVQ